MPDKIRKKVSAIKPPVIGEQLSFSGLLFDTLFGLILFLKFGSLFILYFIYLVQ